MRQNLYASTSQFLACCALTVLAAAIPAHAQSRSQVDLPPTLDPRGPVELTLCSQNLQNYGLLPDARSRDASMTKERLAEKESNLVSRFVKAKCDLIAVQELLGKDEQTAKKALGQLAQRLRQRTGRIFDISVGPTSDGKLSIGFLAARDRVEILNTVSFDRVELPKLTAKQRPRQFSRGPLELQVTVKGLGDSIAKTMSVINVHFKSKRGGSGDPSGLEYETLRMEMAEALRRIVETRHRPSFTRRDQLLAIVGDRNSNFDTASARILEGMLTLKNFQGEAPCRLSKRGVPLCQAGTASEQKLFSVLTTDPELKLRPGTFKFKKEYSWLDDILLPAELLPLTWASPLHEGDYDSGIVYEPKASDHALVYTRLNW